MFGLKQKITTLLHLVRTEGSFVRNSAWMFTSSGVSILIQLIFFPILARIYSPEVYGVFGIFNFYSTTIGSALALGYNQAFVLPKTTRKFSSLLHLTFWLSLGLSLIAALFFLFCGDWLLAQFDHQELGFWMYAIAPTAFFMSLDRVTSDWAIRNKEFRMQTITSTATTLAVKSFNVAYGALISATVGGLILTTLLQHFLRVVTYFKWVLTDAKERIKDKITTREMRTVASEYKEFPLFIYWGNVLNMFSNSFPAAILPWLGFGLNDVGFYGFSLVVLDLPLRLLGAGVASVFMQKATELIDRPNNEIAHHTWRLFKNIVGLSSVFLFFIFAFGEPLYVIAFGEEWRVAGQTAEILGIFYFFRLISNPIASLFNTLRREKHFFIFQVLLMIVRALSLIIGAYYTQDFVQLMWIFSLSNAVMYFVFCIWIFAIIKFSLTKTIVLSILSSTLALGLAYAIKTFLL
jgi:O-antigen/teichoic acid export membrane protein